jgi:alcohol dehydrogenase (NADP+)
MGYPETFKGFASFSAEKWSDFKLHEYKPRAFTEYDVDVKISHCGVCGSDVHTIKNQGVGVSLLLFVFTS